jgi:hypothetical protein
VRVGRPIRALPQPLCDYCGAHAVLAKYGETSYPYREDPGALWVCPGCQAWTGIHPRSTRNVPLGRLADGALRDTKMRLHDTFEPLVAGKIRCDGVNPFEARAKAIRWVAGELGFEPVPGSIHNLSLEQCEQAIRHVEAFIAQGRAASPGDRA